MALRKVHEISDSDDDEEEKEDEDDDKPTKSAKRSYSQKSPEKEPTTSKRLQSYGKRKKHEILTITGGTKISKIKEKKNLLKTLINFPEKQDDQTMKTNNEEFGRKKCVSRLQQLQDINKEQCPSENETNASRRNGKQIERVFQIISKGKKKTISPSLSYDSLLFSSHLEKRKFKHKFDLIGFEQWFSEGSPCSYGFTCYRTGDEHSREHSHDSRIRGFFLTKVEGLQQKYNADTFTRSLEDILHEDIDDELVSAVHFRFSLLNSLLIQEFYENIWCYSHIR